MADLKTTIAQTENLKNKVKLAKDRINETVVRGGGITSKSLSEIPNNIKSMISKNYKKIAIIEMNEELPISNSYPSYPQKTVKFPQIAFKPTRFLCYIEELAGEKNKFVLDSNEKDGTYKKPRGYCRTATVELNSFTQTTASFTAYGGIGGSGDGIFRTKLYKIIAIE